MLVIKKLLQQLNKQSKYLPRILYMLKLDYRGNLGENYLGAFLFFG